MGVGSSGAVLGMLASWIVWILFRWYVLRNLCLSISIFFFNFYSYSFTQSFLSIFLSSLFSLLSSLPYPPSFLFSLISPPCLPPSSLSYVYRKKIPEHCRKKRNCQMSVVVLSVVITLATSAAPFVDWYVIESDLISFHFFLLSLICHY